MILVDSSVLVALLRDEDDPGADLLREALRQHLTIGIEAHIYQEVLQGARTEADWNQLDEYLSTQVIYGLRHGIASHREAARIFFDCRRRGLTVRSLVDCIVAQTAIENDLALLARDRDYDHIASVRSLRLWRGLGG